MKITFIIISALAAMSSYGVTNSRKFKCSYTVDLSFGNSGYDLHDTAYLTLTSVASTYRLDFEYDFSTSVELDYAGKTFKGQRFVVRPSPFPIAKALELFSITIPENFLAPIDRDVKPGNIDIYTVHRRKGQQGFGNCSLIR